MQRNKYRRWKIKYLRQTQKGINFYVSCSISLFTSGLVNKMPNAIEIFRTSVGNQVNEMISDLFPHIIGKVSSTFFSSIKNNQIPDILSAAIDGSLWSRNKIILKWGNFENLRKVMTLCFIENVRSLLCRSFVWDYGDAY